MMKDLYEKAVKIMMTAVEGKTLKQGKIILKDILNTDEFIKSLAPELVFKPDYEKTVKAYDPIGKIKQNLVYYKRKNKNENPAIGYEKYSKAIGDDVLVEWIKHPYRG